MSTHRVLTPEYMCSTPKKPRVRPPLTTPCPHTGYWLLSICAVHQRSLEYGHHWQLHVHTQGTDSWVYVQYTREAETMATIDHSMSTHRVLTPEYMCITTEKPRVWPPLTTLTSTHRVLTPEYMCSTPEKPRVRPPLTTPCPHTGYWLLSICAVHQRSLEYGHHWQLHVHTQGTDSWVYVQYNREA